MDILMYTGLNYVARTKILIVFFSNILVLERGEHPLANPFNECSNEKRPASKPQYFYSRGAIVILIKCECIYRYRCQWGTNIY